LTPFERKLWRGDKPIHPSVLKNCKDKLAQLEATLQAKDAQIAELTAQIEAESDVQYAQRSEIVAKDEQIEALALAVLNAWAFPEEAEGTERMRTLARAAVGDGEVTSFREIIQAKDAQIAALVTALESIIAIEPADPQRRKLELAQDIARLTIKEATS